MGQTSVKLSLTMRTSGWVDFYFLLNAIALSVMLHFIASNLHISLHSMLDVVKNVFGF